MIERRGSVPADPLKIALYSQSTFDKPNPNQQEMEAMLAAASDIGSSDYGTIILGQWHVHRDGSIYYNDTPLADVKHTLQVIPEALKRDGNVKKVLLTFGPFGSDFEGIKHNLQQFKTTIANLHANTAIDGLDWDLEQDYDLYGDLLVDLTRWASGLGMTVTSAPYTYDAFWTKVLKKTNTGGSAGFSWWNLQLYGGASYPDWVKDLDEIVANPEAFIVPGYSITQGVPQVETPSYVESHLRRLHSSYASLDGGFIWRYEDMKPEGYSPTQYASAIAAGLDGATGGDLGSL